MPGLVTDTFVGALGVAADADVADTVNAVPANRTTLAESAKILLNLFIVLLDAASTCPQRGAMTSASLPWTVRRPDADNKVQLQGGTRRRSRRTKPFKVVVKGHGVRDVEPSDCRTRLGQRTTAFVVRGP